MTSPEHRHVPTGALAVLADWEVLPQSDVVRHVSTRETRSASGLAGFRPRWNAGAHQDAKPCSGASVSITRKERSPPMNGQSSSAESTSFSSGSIVKLLLDTCGAALRGWESK